ncbi:TonB-dependent receptor plug domain-containing protein [Methylocucumis oryzae]|uniref:TonB-dependent receptor plug domain-containing protein n=1 Tax=Methylocucumis oryzae TaxID=1632867 RepID=UPI000698FB2A|nr:TonB-dependent receptor [Methylocucumis oryzae]
MANFLRDDSFVNRLGYDAEEEWTSGRGGFRVDWASAEGQHALMLQGDMFYGQYDENNIKYQSLTSQQSQQLNAFVLNRVEKQGGNLLAKWNYNQSLASHMVAQFFYDTLHAQEDLTSPNILQSEIIDIDFQHILALNAAHEFTWGLNYRLSLVELTPLNEFFQTEYRPGTFENNRLSIFMQDKWRVHDDVELTLGSKFEHHTNNNFEYEPSLRLLWQAAKQHRLWTGISRAVRLPAVTDYQAKVGFDTDTQIFTFNQNKTLTSDEVISYELGYRYWNTDIFSIDIAAYYNQYHNSLVADNQFF